ncbi:MAG: prepilin-type N-terminal cleavage/methylation domain-containing protein [Kiloniellales bacterium]|nr:prepilin-type N-terminal cleavage/methylation domain-containing protein [Kiloniellales bacterium]
MKPSEDGFTLLEVLVAFAILALILGVVFQTYSTGFRSAETASDHMTATLLAESKLASIGVTQSLEEGEAVGDFDDGYHWRTTIRPFRAEDGEADGPLPIRAYEITVTVGWGDRDAGPAVSLTTLRVEPSL